MTEYWKRILIPAGISLLILICAPRIFSQAQEGQDSPPAQPVSTIESAGDDIQEESTSPAEDVQTDSLAIPDEDSPPEAEAKSEEQDNLTLPLPSPAGMAERARNWLERHANLEAITWWKLIYLLAGIVVAVVIGRIIRWLIEHYGSRLAAKTTTEVDDIIFNAVGKPASLFVFACGMYVSALPIIFSFAEHLQLIYGRICLAVAATAITWAIYRLTSVIDYLLTNIAKRTENKLDDLIVEIVRKTLKVAIVILSVLFIGQSILGLNITTLLGAAGVMGLAIAFAAQDTISNFFGSVMIILDQPFKVGERVVISGIDGVVEHVGFRSMRLRTLDGHLVTIPNKNTANSTIENISARPSIKTVANIGLVYDTPAEKMTEALKILREIYADHEGMDPEFPPRIYFNSFNDWSLNILVITWYTPPDYWICMEWNESRNLEILRRFNEAGLDFAFPTNTTYLAYDEKRRLELDITQKK